MFCIFQKLLHFPNSIFDRVVGISNFHFVSDLTLQTVYMPNSAIKLMKNISPDVKYYEYNTVYYIYCDKFIMGLSRKKQRGYDDMEFPKVLKK